MGAPTIMLSSMRRKSAADQKTAAALATKAKTATAQSDDSASKASAAGGGNGVLRSRISSPMFTLPKSRLLCNTRNKVRSESLSSADETAGTDIDTAPSHDTNDAAADGKQKQRSVHLSIAPDAESESMQVVLVDDKQSSSPIKEDDCFYRVDSVEYLVKHGDENASPKKENNDANESMLVNILEEVAAEGGGGSEKKKKSKMGGLFKKSGKGSSSNNNNNGDQNGDKKDDAGNSKDSGNANNNNNNSGRGNNPDGTPFNSDSYFGPQRTAFAKESTLPLHSGSEQTAPKDHPSWTPVDGTEFKVRAGPNYPKNGKKESSGESLYEVYSVRYFRSKKRTVGGATRIMPLPNHNESNPTKVATEGVASININDNEDGVPDMGKHHPELKGTKIPDVLVVHFMLPYEPPNMFKQKDDGTGGECVYYLRPSQRFLDEISGRVPITPATRLFAKWCEECESKKEMRSRFKCMALVRDIDKHNFGLLKNYNGKPVLITESGRACSGYHGDVRYLEMTANVHYWAFMAKKGFVSLIPKFVNMQMEVGFTIEAHADSEMPECMLGSTVLSYISDKTGPMIAPCMQEPVHEHQS